MYVNHQLVLAAGDSFVTHLPRPRSNHASILINLIAQSSQTNENRRPKLFRFEEACVQDPGTECAIRAAWIQVQGDGISKTMTMKHILGALNVRSTATIRKEIIKVERELSKDTNWNAGDLACAKFSEIDANVSVIIDEDLHCWNTKLLDDVFMPSEAAVIRSILISWRQCCDKNNHPGPSHNSSTVNWKRLWALTIPAKIKHFMWRLCSNAIPLRAKLRQRGVDVTEECPLCKMELEGTEHLFMHCPVAQLLWFASPLSIRFSNSTPFWNWICDMVGHQDQAVTYMVSTLCWSIWKGRNAKIFENKNVDPAAIMNMGVSMLKDFDDANTHHKLDSEQHAHREARTQSWQTPPTGWMALNTNAAIFMNDSIGLGAVVRNHGGLIYFAASKLCPFNVIQAVSADISSE
ncbi:hypothetical protein RIF29_27186 [Crotalaria pallida]|uniref:Reverse transcriptase zinc-binding domain-containing protein n=1 Tax=Crotalaria pallida TaxID=3830 RepID=A0AAN9I085_CROPI